MSEFVSINLSHWDQKLSEGSEYDDFGNRIRRHHKDSTTKFLEDTQRAKNNENIRPRLYPLEQEDKIIIEKARSESNERLSFCSFFIDKVSKRLHDLLQSYPSFVTKAIEEFCNEKNILNLVQCADVLESFRIECKKAKSSWEMMIHNAFVVSANQLMRRYDEGIKLARDLGQKVSQDVRMTLPLEPIKAGRRLLNLEDDAQMQKFILNDANDHLVKEMRHKGQNDQQNQLKLDNFRTAETRLECQRNFFKNYRAPPKKSRIILKDKIRNTEPSVWFYQDPETSHRVYNSSNKRQKHYQYLLMADQFETLKDSTENQNIEPNHKVTATKRKAEDDFGKELPKKVKDIIENQNIGPNQKVYVKTESEETTTKRKAEDDLEKELPKKVNDSLTSDNIPLLEEEASTLDDSASTTNVDVPAEPVIKKPKSLTYVPYEFIDDEVREQCISCRDVYKNPGMADIVRIYFDYAKFAKLKPECPPITPARFNVLYTNQPLLKFAFGYAPKFEEKSGKVINNLRYQLSDFANDEAREYAAKFLIPMEDFFSELVWRNRAVWPHGARAPKNGELTKDLVDARFSSGRLVRNSDVFGEYIQHKLITQTENKRQEIKEDPYTAFLKVWDWGFLDDNGVRIRRFLANKLDEKNSTNYDRDGKIGDGKIIIDKDMYGSAIYSFEKFYFSKDAWGVTTVQHVALIATKSELDAEKILDDAPQECPIVD